MADPVLHLLAGPNGSGKSTLWTHILEPELHLEFVNADLLAEEQAARHSFATVFSHESKVEFVTAAVAAGYLVTLHVIAVPEALAVARVHNRVENGGHPVPEGKIRERYGRLWAHVVQAIPLVERCYVYDNTTAASPFRLVAECERGALLWSDWPIWMPEELRRLA